MARGKIILIFGISAVGKTYYKNLLIEKFKLEQLNRITTRVKRKVKENKTDVFISKEKFKNIKKGNELYIYTKINNEFYAYKKNDIDKIQDGINLIGDCYYKLLGKLKNSLKGDLITICIQPKNLEFTKRLIISERSDYKVRIKNAIKEYKYFQNHQEYFDYIVYTNYDKKTENEIINIISNILSNKLEEKNVN